MYDCYLLSARLFVEIDGDPIPSNEPIANIAVSRTSQGSEELRLRLVRRHVQGQ